MVEYLTLTVKATKEPIDFRFFKKWVRVPNLYNGRRSPFLIHPLMLFSSQSLLLLQYLFHFLLASFFVLCFLPLIHSSLHKFPSFHYSLPAFVLISSFITCLFHHSMLPSLLLPSFNFSSPIFLHFILLYQLSFPQRFFKSLILLHSRLQNLLPSCIFTFASTYFSFSFLP